MARLASFCYKVQTRRDLLTLGSLVRRAAPGRDGDEGLGGQRGEQEAREESSLLRPHGR
jgi:hypothetical protein